MVAALLLVTAVMVPAMGAAADSSLSVAVEQQPDTGEAVVSATHDGTAVENGTLLVNASGNYSANESYALDSNGTATLPAPNETVDVELTVEYENTTVTETATFVPLSESLILDVEQHEDGSATAWVTQYDDPVENATVTVAVGENETYDGVGEYVTDQNGTIALPVPDTSVDVSLTAEYENLTAMDSITLSGTELTVSASQDAERAVTIAVMDGGEYVDSAEVAVESENYTYTGSYTAENGTVALPAPTQNVTVTVTATADNETATTTADLTVATDANPNNDFAEDLGRFINFLKSTGVDGPLGQEISAFVHENNPSAADDERGPPEHANQNTEMETETAQNGPPSFANSQDDSESDDRHGPPENANANGQKDRIQDRDQDHVENQTESQDFDFDADNLTEGSDTEADSVEAGEDDEETDDEEDGEESENDHRRGQPEHANGR